MDTDSNCCGNSCGCTDGGCDDIQVEKSEQKNLDSVPTPCVSSCGCEDDDDGFGDYMGADHDRVMRDRDRLRVEETMQKVRDPFFDLFLITA
jgi:hypothetical protein